GARGRGQHLTVAGLGVGALDESPCHPGTADRDGLLAGTRGTIGTDEGEKRLARNGRVEGRGGHLARPVHAHLRLQHEAGHRGSRVLHCHDDVGGGADVAARVGGPGRKRMTAVGRRPGVPVGGRAGWGGQGGHRKGERDRRSRGLWGSGRRGGGWSGKGSARGGVGWCPPWAGSGGGGGGGGATPPAPPPPRSSTGPP